MNRRREGKSCFDLIEEATHLLRVAPVATLAIYYLGAIPFVLGVLFFWGDMSRSPFASQHLADASFGLTILFFWMKFWQTIFARHVRAQITGQLPPRFSFRRCARIFLAQTILQPIGLFLIPLAILCVIPAAWIYAFFQNVTALSDGEEIAISKLLKKAAQQAALWPRQNFLTLAILFAFAFFVFLNWTTVGFMLPQLFKMLFGVQSVFTQSPLALLNTTFFAAMFGLTYLCMDPILKINFALRCFYGESIQSGEDLKADLKSFALPARKILAAILIFISTLAAISVKAEKPSTPIPAAKKISPANLDQAINQTIHERKFTWRMPREKIAGDANEGFIARFFDKIGTMIRHWTHAVIHWLQQLLRKLFPHPQRVYSAPNSGGYGWIMSVRILIYVLIAAAIIALAIFLLRVWQGRQKIAPVASQPILPVPDLADENVRADQLPEDGWTKLARELLERGEFRLAMRAFYLASLAHLAARNLISLARFKSNRDYERELRRRAHAFPDLPPAFGKNIFTFERIWYGSHEVNREVVNEFSANVERIKAAG